MKSFKGVVKKLDLEGGVWVLESAGTCYQLTGGPRDLYQEGKSVKIQGEIRQDMMGIGMTGPILDVKKVEKIG